MEKTHEALYLRKWSFGQQNIMDTPTNCNLIINFPNGPFKYADGETFWNYAGTNSYSLCVQFLILCSVTPL
jgi:hypothetical protein